MVLCALVGGIWLVVQGQRTSALDRTAQQFQASASPSASSAAPVAVISDDLAAPAQSGTPVAEWPALVQASLGVPVDSLSTAGSGYTTRPLTAQFGGTFRARATAISSSTQVVVIMGGANDQRATQTVLLAAVSETISNAHVAAPRARIVVVGPADTSTDRSASLLAVRDTVRRAASLAKVTFVDPLAQDWLSSGTGYVAADGHSLTTKGERAIASRMTALIRPLLTSGT